MQRTTPAVSSGSTVQIAQAVFLPCPVKLDTVLHPVRAWNVGSARAFSGPRPDAISWPPSHRKLLPVPNASHSSFSGCSAWVTDTASTTTSVSTVRIIILWWPCWAVRDAYSNMRLPASSWLHRASEARSDSGDLLRTASPSVMTSCVSSWSNHLRRDSDRNLNSSVLLLSTRVKFCQFPGMAAAANTWSAHSFSSLCFCTVFQ